MPNATATVTSITGPAVAVTSKVFTNVTDMKFDVARSVLTLSFTDGNGPRILDVSLNPVTTVTYSITSGVATVTIS